MEFKPKNVLIMGYTSRAGNDIPTAIVLEYDGATIELPIRGSRIKVSFETLRTIPAKYNLARQQVTINGVTMIVASNPAALSDVLIQSHYGQAVFTNRLEYSLELQEFLALFPAEFTRAVVEKMRAIMDKIKQLKGK